MEEINRKRFWNSFIHSVTKYFRKKRGKFLLQSFPNISDLRICDLGGSIHFWEKLDIKVPKENITIYNIAENETTTVAGKLRSEYSYQLFDGIHVPVDDDYFDLTICNSVIEHIQPTQRPRFVKELFRISKNIFCQTPAWSFPIEPHLVLPFIHWIPNKFGYYLVWISPWRLLGRPSREQVKQYYYNIQLLKKTELEELFPDCSLHYERFCGLIKSYYITFHSA